MTLIEKSRFYVLCIFVHFPIEFSATVVYYQTFWQQKSKGPGIEVVYVNIVFAWDNQIQSVLFSHKNKKASKIRIRLRVETEEGLTGELL